MAFVYDAETLAAGKADLAPSTVPADKKVTASEYNALIAAVTDLRTALLSGQYHGLVSTPSAPVAGAGEIRLRDRGGALEISSHGDRYRRIDLDFRPEDYGAAGDGSTDDGAALEAAFSAATAAGGRVLLRAGHTYVTGRELQSSLTDALMLVGAAGKTGVLHSSTIKAAPGSGLRSILTLRTSGCVVENVSLDGNATAKTCLYMFGASLCKFSNLHVANALLDGGRVCGDGDAAHHSSLDLATAAWVRGVSCELRATDLTTHAACRCATTSGSVTVTFSGGPDLTTLGIVAGGGTPAGIWILHSGGIYQGHIMAVTADTVTLRNADFDVPPTFTESGLHWVIGNWRSSICDTNAFYNLSSERCGSVHASTAALAEYSTVIARRTGYADTAAVTSGSAVVTLSGGDASTVTMRARPGDFMCVGADAQRRRRMILEVHPDGKRITLDQAFDYSASGLQWGIGVGWGYREDRNGDANIQAFSGTGLHRGHGCGAFQFGGFYGPLLAGGQIDYCGQLAISVGGPTSTPNIGAVLLRNYMEGCGPGVPEIYLHSAQGVLIFSPLDRSGVGAWEVEADGASWGEYRGRYGATSVGADTAYTSAVPATRLVRPEIIGVNPWAVQSTNESGWTPGATLALTANQVNALPASQYVFAGTPTLSTTRTGIYVVQCAFGHSNSITLQDENTLSGSRLRLKSPTVRLEQGETIVLLWDGTWWWEITRGSVNAYPYADTSATPGNATVTAPKGRAAVASGASTITITTPRVFGTGLYGVGVSQVDIMWEDDPGGHHRVTIPSGGGSFTVTLPAAVGADTKFRWRIED